MKYWYRFYSAILNLLDCDHCYECDKIFKEYRLDNNMCYDCYTNLYCECGQRLEDSWGSPGDGFCIRCR